MSYTELDLPLQLHHGEILTLADGTEVRFESCGEGKNVFLADTFEPTTEIFPGNEYSFEAGGSQYCLTADFGDQLLVEKK